MLHIKKIKPLFNHLLTTAEKFDEDMVESGVIIAKKGDLKLWQKVVAVGPTARNIEEGDMVMIIPDHFAVKKYNKNSVQNDLDNNPVLTYHFPFETMDDDKGEPQDYLYLSDNDIRYVFEGEEKAESLILPIKKQIIV